MNTITLFRIQPTQFNGARMAYANHHPGIVALPETGTLALPYAQAAAHLCVDEALRTMDRDRRR
jgi:hypothetical protein